MMFNLESATFLTLQMSSGATVTVADLLELRADGLTEEEIWSLLCQSVQTLQDLFLSEKINRHEVVPLVNPNTLGISRRGTVVISLVDEIQPHQEPFLAPEFPKRRRCLNSLDWEKMWVYSLGKTLRFALKTTDEPKSLIVLKNMTEKEPDRRATLMSLLNTISDHCKRNVPMKPSSHLVMEMYKEVFGSPPQCLLPSRTPDFNHAGAERICSSEASREPQFRCLNDRNKTSATSSSVNGSLGLSVEMKRNPVQRAPSRLYRVPLADSFSACKRLLPKACVGPEFVVRGMEPSKVVHVGDVKASHRKALTVILLTGQKVRITCDPHAVTCGKLFEILVQVENLEDDYIFGLASTINGDFVFLPSEMKLHKVAPSGWRDGRKNLDPSSFFLYVRVKFFLPSLWGFRNGKTKHLIYLQLRRSLLEQQIKCELEELLTLGGLALQAEFGDFDENEHGSSSYFLLEHYIPEDLIDERFELEARLQGNHKSRCGLDPGLAEEIFNGHVQRLPEYGSHHYTALWVRKSVNIPMWVTVNPQGVYLYEKKKNVLDRKIHEAFVWKNIQGLSCNENYFRLTPQDVFGQKVTPYKLRMDNKKSFFLFQLASFHHQFFLKLRIELSPLHALSREFGVAFKKDRKNISYFERKTSQSGKRISRVETHLEKRDDSEPFEDIEERQNKENENPQENKKDKRTGVKMGVSSFSFPCSGTFEASGRRNSFSEVSNGSMDAYVIDSSVRASEEKFTYDLHESLPSAMASKWNDVSWEEERILRRVYLAKDKYGSFGLEVVEGSNGGLFVENVLKGKGDNETESVERGDQLMSANGICLLDLNYREALNILKSAGNEIEIVLSRICKRETRKKPLELEYLKHIRYETANEVEGEESEVPLRSGLR